MVVIKGAVELVSKTAAVVVIKGNVGLVSKTAAVVVIKGAVELVSKTAAVVTWSSCQTAAVVLYNAAPHCCPSQTV